LQQVRVFNFSSLKNLYWIVVPIFVVEIVASYCVCIWICAGRSSSTFPSTGDVETTVHSIILTGSTATAVELTKVGGVVGLEGLFVEMVVAVMVTTGLPTCVGSDGEVIPFCC
jgi:hypothetical protein